MAGHGHWPLIPIRGRENPSGAAFTQVMFQFRFIRLPVGGAGVVYGANDVDVDEILLVLEVDVVDVDLIDVEVVEVRLLELDVDVDLILVDELEEMGGGAPGAAIP